MSNFEDAYLNTSCSGCNFSTISLRDVPTTVNCRSSWVVSLWSVGCTIHSITRRSLIMPPQREWITFSHQMIHIALISWAQRSTSSAVWSGMPSIISQLKTNSYHVGAIAHAYWFQSSFASQYCFTMGATQWLSVMGRKPCPICGLLHCLCRRHNNNISESRLDTI